MLDADASLGAGERPAGAGVRSPPEGEMFTNVGPVDLELTGVVKVAWIPTGSSVEDHQGRPGRNVDTAHCRRCARQAEVALYRALDPEAFLDEVRNPLGVLSEQ